MKMEILPRLARAVRRNLHGLSLLYCGLPFFDCRHDADSLLLGQSGQSAVLDYHDTEWGVPCHDERRLFEMLNLEGAQAG
jgi:hypothetical protein